MGRTHDKEITINIQERMLREGVSSITVTLTGGDLVLLQPLEGENIKELIQDYANFLKNISYQMNP